MIIPRHDVQGEADSTLQSRLVSLANDLGPESIRGKAIKILAPNGIFTSAISYVGTSEIRNCAAASQSHIRLGVILEMYYADGGNHAVEMQQEEEPDIDGMTGSTIEQATTQIAAVTLSTRLATPLACSTVGDLKR